MSLKATKSEKLYYYSYFVILKGLKSYPCVCEYFSSIAGFFRGCKNTFIICFPLAVKEIGRWVEIQNEQIKYQA